MKHLFRCIGIPCTCPKCPGCEVERVSDPSKELCPECNWKADQHRREMGIDEHERTLEAC